MPMSWRRIIGSSIAWRLVSHHSRTAICCDHGSSPGAGSTAAVVEDDGLTGAGSVAGRTGVVAQPERSSDAGARAVRNRCSRDMSGTRVRDDSDSACNLPAVAYSPQRHCSTRPTGRTEVAAVGNGRHSRRDAPTISAQNGDQPGENDRSRSCPVWWHDDGRPPRCRAAPAPRHRAAGWSATTCRTSRRGSLPFFSGSP